MEGRKIIPDNQVAWRPAVAVDEVWLGRMLVELWENIRGLVGLEPLDLVWLPIHVKRLAARHRMRLHDLVPDIRQRRPLLRRQWNVRLRVAGNDPVVVRMKATSSLL